MNLQYTNITDACLNGDLNCVEYFYKNGADVEKVDSSMRNAIGIAAEYGHLNLIEYFYKNGIDLTVNNIITIAAENGQLHIVKYIIENVVNDDPQFKWNLNYSIRASIVEGKIEILKYLHEEVGIEIPDMYKKYPKQWNSVHGNSEISNYLLSL